MSDYDQSDKTLPSLGELAAGLTAYPRYQLTLVFHPQTRRIGECADLSFEGRRPLSIGRIAPAFRTCDGAEGSPIDDPYVSRLAVVLAREPGGLRLARPLEASRCRVAGRELTEELFFTDAELDIGVPLLLAHSVVVLLRRTSLPRARGGDDCGMIGSGESAQALRQQVLRAAGSDSDVLLRGETGTGKELVARAIHQRSARAAGFLVSVNMAAVPPSLAAASLFGAVRGAYTGASRSLPGYFRQAQGGTLFLDEVGDTPDEVQPLLLRALQEREVQVVGGELERFDARVISATDIAIESDDTNFRAALLHRLGAIEIQLPPLRERREDIGELLLHFLREAAEQESRADWLPDADSEALVIARWADIFYAFVRYAWPGNVRQLANLARQALLGHTQHPVIPEALRETVLGAAPQCVGESAGEPASSPASARRLSDISEAEFREAMQLCRYEITAVADTLGVSRQSVYRRVQTSAKFRLIGDVPEEELREVLAQCEGDLRETASTLRVSETALRGRLRATGTPQ